MKNLPVVALLLFLGLSGCSSTSNSPRGDSIDAQPSSQHPTIKTSDRLTPSDNFHNNEGYYRALFNMNTADCKSGNGIAGVYIVKLHGQSVVKLRGGMVGDRIVQVSAHRPKTSSDLTYIIKRITPDTVVPVVLDRGGKIFEILVVPPPWKPSDDQRAFIDSPYKISPCHMISLSGAHE